jgi:diguanylate cyclase (GGDEF)-like protein
MAVALMDLDHFKAYNDAHGHPAGDAALRLAATGWRGRLRAGDLLARLGGEEFAVLLPGASPEDAYAALEHLRRATPPGLTVSIGFAGHVPGDTGESLLARADAALYAAKRAGRDRVHASPEAVTSAPRAARLGVAAATTSQL